MSQISSNQGKYTFLQNRNNISATITKYFSKSCKNILGFDNADRSTCTDVKFSNWTIVPLSVQTAGEILVSYWSPARQDFRLPFWLTNHVSAGQNCREIVQFQDLSLFNSWSDHISKYYTPQFCSFLETCFCQTQPWWFSPVCVQPISDATAWPQLRLLRSSAVLEWTPPCGQQAAYSVLHTKARLFFTTFPKQDLLKFGHKIQAVVVACWILPLSLAYLNQTVATDRATGPLPVHLITSFQSCVSPLHADMKTVSCLFESRENALPGLMQTDQQRIFYQRSLIIKSLL